MKFSWNIAIHAVQLGWSAFVVSAVADHHAEWWMPAVAGALVAVDGVLSSTSASQDPTKS